MHAASVNPEPGSNSTYDVCTRHTSGRRHVLTRPHVGWRVSPPPGPSRKVVSTLQVSRFTARRDQGYGPRQRSPARHRRRARGGFYSSNRCPVKFRSNWVVGQFLVRRPWDLFRRDGSGRGMASPIWGHSESLRSHPSLGSRSAALQTAMRNARPKATRPASRAIPKPAPSVGPKVGSGPSASTYASASSSSRNGSTASNRSTLPAATSSSASRSIDCQRSLQNQAGTRSTTGRGRRARVELTVRAGRRRRGPR